MSLLYCAPAVQCYIVSWRPYHIMLRFYYAVFLFLCYLMLPFPFPIILLYFPFYASVFMLSGVYKYPRGKGGKEGKQQ